MGVGVSTGFDSCGADLNSPLVAGRPGRFPRLLLSDSFRMAGAVRSLMADQIRDLESSVQVLVWAEAEEQ
jgi:hypothetical protein